jgi:hypothetical protein
VIEHYPKVMTPDKKYRIGRIFDIANIRKSQYHGIREGVDVFSKNYCNDVIFQAWILQILLHLNLL